MDSFAGFVSLSLVKATPLVFAALAGTICERAGILNIALEGALTVGAFAAVAVSFATGSPVLGLFGAEDKYPSPGRASTSSPPAAPRSGSSSSSGSPAHRPRCTRSVRAAKKR